MSDEHESGDARAPESSPSPRGTAAAVTPGDDAQYHIRALVATAEARIAGLCLADTLGGVLDLILSREGVAHGFVASLDADRRTLSLTVARGLFEHIGLRGIEKGSGLVGRVFSQAEPVLIDDYENWSGRGIDLQAAGARALMLVPLCAGEEVLGVLGLADSRPGRRFTDDHLSALLGLRELLVMILLDEGVVVRPRRTVVEAEAKLESASGLEAVWSVLDLVPAAVLLKDRENRVLGANLAAGRAMGLPREELAGQYLWEADPQNAARSYRADLEVLETLEPMVDVLEEHISIDGAHRWWRVDRAPWYGSDGEVAGVLVVARDVTEDHVLRQSLEASRQAADRANRVMSHYLTAMTHEVRVPLQRVLSAAGQLLRASAHPDQRSAAEEIERSADGVLSMVQDMLDFARVEAGNLAVEVADFRVRSAVEDVLDLLARNAHRRGIELAAHVDSSVPETVAGDAERLRQILVQLLAQALRACEGGEIVVVVRSVSSDPQTPTLRFEVRASDWSHDPNRLAQLFDPYLRGEEGLDASDHGPGIGLALAHQLLRLLQGQGGVERHRADDFGAWCQIPFRLAFAGPTAEEPDPVWQGARLLVVEDRPTLAAFLRRRLEDLGCHVDVAHDGVGARRLLSASREEGWQYRLCFVDQGLPDGETDLLVEEIGDPAVRMIPFGSVPPRRDGERRIAHLTKPIRQSRLRDLLCERLGGETPAEIDGAVEAGRRVLLLETEHLDRKLVFLALQRLGCEVDLVATVEEVREHAALRAYDLVLVSTSVGADALSALVPDLRRPQIESGWAPILGLARRADRGEHEQCLAVGMDGCLAKPPHFDELRRVLRRRGALRG